MNTPVDRLDLFEVIQDHAVAVYRYQWEAGEEDPEAVTKQYLYDEFLELGFSKEQANLKAEQYYDGIEQFLPEGPDAGASIVGYKEII